MRVCFQRQLNGKDLWDFSRQLFSKYFPGAPRPIMGAVHQENIWRKVDDQGLGVKRVNWEYGISCWYPIIDKSLFVSCCVDFITWWPAPDKSIIHLRISALEVVKKISSLERPFTKNDKTYMPRAFQKYYKIFSRTAFFLIADTYPDLTKLWRQYGMAPEHLIYISLKLFQVQKINNS